MGFLNRNLALILDGVGQRYGTLPSIVLGMPPGSGRGFLLNIAVVNAAVREQLMLTSTEGQIHAKQRMWPPEIRAEIRGMGLKLG